MLEYFKPEEFSCGCGKCGKGYEDMKTMLLSMLNSARARAGVPFQVTSSIRCDEHNMRVGGSVNSAHLRGWAVDISTPTSQIRHRLVRAALDVGFHRIGIASTFVHLDCDPTLAGRTMWVYHQ